MQNVGNNHRPHPPAAELARFRSPSMSIPDLSMAMAKRGDGRRRWSLTSASIASSSGISSGSSSSSQERLQEKLVQNHALLHLHHEDPGVRSFCHHHHPHHGHNLHLSLHQRIVNANQQFSSNESNPSIMSVEEESGRISPISPMIRPRSRSLSSPIRSPGSIDNEIIMMNSVYKERFPKATQQMEDRLQKFIDDHSELDSELASDAIVRFAHHQIVELARDCLQKSQDKLVKSSYFHELVANLERLHNECREKSGNSERFLRILIKKLLVIVSRPARLLECLEFNPEEFFRLLEEAEQGRKAEMTQQGVCKTDFPQYIINKLGLNRDPLSDFVAGIGGEEPEPPVKEVPKDETASSEQKDGSKEESEPKVKQPSEEDYETIKLISNGAYGAVYLVRHKETRQRFAMKKINKQNLVLRNQVEQVFAERDIMSFSDNPFVVSMLCSFETKRYLCMVMEYVEGGDCATLLKNLGPLPVDLAKLYFAETVLAVEYLHSYGIVHRDLKPDNLLITAMGHIKLTDFGLSKVGLMNMATNLYEGYLDRDTKQFNDKQVFGTPEYIAPEVILRQGYGKPVDWWSTGIILYEFLIGCVPFFGETPEELFAHVINDNIEWPDDDEWPLPEEAKHLISQLLQQSPLDRLGTGGAHEVKEHGFFHGLNWNDCLRCKAEFVPQLEDEDDTSYFDTRSDRYNHELEDSEQEETDDSGSMFSSFSSCSPRYHKVYSRIEKELAQERQLGKSSSTSSIADAESASKPPTPETSLSRTKSLNESRTPVVTVEPAQKTEGSAKSNAADADSKGCGNLAVVAADASQTHTDSSGDSPERSGHKTRPSLPRFSISVDETRVMSSLCPPSIREIPPAEEAAAEKSAAAAANSSISYPSSPSARISNIPVLHAPASLAAKAHKNRAVIKSASASGLSLIIPAPHNPIEEISKGNAPSNLIGSPGNSSTSSRDASPNRDTGLGQLTLKPPIIIRKGARGFGFTLKAIRVYFGDSDTYTVQHLVLAVETNSPAFDSGLRPGDLITHINGEPIQGLLHPQVLQLVLSGGDKINIRTTPLENTTIKTGGRKRNPVTSKMIRRPTIIKHRAKAPPVKRSDSEKKRKSSLLRRLSSKRASAEIHQLMSLSPTSQLMTPSRSYQSLRSDSRSVSNATTSTPKDATPNTSASHMSMTPPPSHLASSAGRLVNRIQYTPSDSLSSPGNSSQSSSPNSTAPNSPANLSNSPHFPRPSNFTGLLNKKIFTRSPRRKSCGAIPLSPLARTPSPALPLVATSPTGPTAQGRSPSPLTITHMPGSSQTTQAFVLQKSLSTSTAVAAEPKGVLVLASPIKKSSSRPKSAEPAGSPAMLRRSQSPEKALKSEVDTHTHFHPKSPLIRLKREGQHVSSLATTSSPPTLAKVAVTNSFTQHAARLSTSFEESGPPADKQTEPSPPKSQLSSDLKEEPKNESSSNDKGKPEEQQKAGTTYQTTVSLVLTKVENVQPTGGSTAASSTASSSSSTAEQPSTSSTSSKAKKEKSKAEKSEKSKTFSPVFIRKTLFSGKDKSKEKDSDKRTKSNSGKSSEAASKK